jgi:hypothetical protein
VNPTSSTINYKEYVSKYVSDVFKEVDNMISCDEESPLDNLKKLTSRILIHNNKREANPLVGDVSAEMLRDLRRLQQGKREAVFPLYSELWKRVENRPLVEMKMVTYFQPHEDTMKYSVQHPEMVASMAMNYASQLPEPMDDISWEEYAKNRKLHFAPPSSWVRGMDVDVNDFRHEMQSKFTHDVACRCSRCMSLQSLHVVAVVACR